MFIGKLNPYDNIYSLQRRIYVTSSMSRHPLHPQLHNLARHAAITKSHREWQQSQQSHILEIKGKYCY